MGKRLGILCVVCVLLLSACGTDGREAEGNVRVVTSFYPIYLLAEEVVKGAENVVLENMAQPQTGCLHDYELTINDMKKLEKADILLINGGGMENFMAQAIEQYPHIKIVDTSKEAHFLEAHHDHEVGEESHEEERNAHIWLNPENTVHQVDEIAKAMGEAVPVERALFMQNAENFATHMEEISLETAEMRSSDEQVALFHEGFGYLAELFDMEGAVEIYAEEYAEPSAKELAEAVQRAKADDIRLFMAADDSGRKYAELLAEECGGQVLILDPITMAGAENDNYESRMKENIDRIKDALQKEGIK